MLTDSPQQPGILTGLAAICRRDILLAWKRPGDVLNPLFFFAMICTLFPLAVGPSAEQLTFSGPGVVWVAALLATLLSLNSLFMSDHEDGSLDQLLVGSGGSRLHPKQVTHRRGSPTSNHENHRRVGGNPGHGQP